MTTIDNSLLQTLNQSRVYVSPDPVTIDSIQHWLCANITDLNYVVIGNMIIGAYGEGEDALQFIAKLDNGMISVDIGDKNNNNVASFICNEELSLVNELMSY